MKQTTVFRGNILLPDRMLEGGCVVCREGIILYVGFNPPSHLLADAVTLTGHYISPGFVDIHVHGGADADYMDGEIDAVITSNKAHARHGTAVVLPTTTTGSTDQLQKMITACEAVRDQWTPADGARIGGVHFYGPYFAEDKVGCHAPEGRRDPQPDEYLNFLRQDIVRIATCAAELPGALDFYEAAKAQDCFITCGHSNADWAELEAGFDRGVRHVDHFWCAMSSVSSLRKRFGMPMRASMEQFVLSNEDMSTEVIADGQHLSHELLRFAYEMIGPHRLCLVTDANRAMDCPPGTYRFGPKDDGSIVISDGLTVRGTDGGLASSLNGMDHMVRTMWKATGAPVWSIVQMASITPARLAGIANRFGSLEIGKAADLLVLSPDLDVESVWLAGEKFA